MQVNLHNAKTHLSRFVELGLDGEDVVIARGLASPSYGWCL